MREQRRDSVRMRWSNVERAKMLFFASRLPSSLWMFLYEYAIGF
jgi:hypothetical protein